jgi:hypothetical protein
MRQAEGSSNLRRCAAWALVAAGMLGASATATLGQTVAGVVIGEPGRVPLAGAEVQLIDETGEVHRQVVTDSAGSFIVRANVPGAYTLRASMIGYDTVTSERLRLELAGVVQVQVVMGADPVPLDAVRVLAQSSARMGPLREFYDRAERGIRGGTGRIFTRADIETGGFTEMRHILLVSPPRAGCPMDFFIDGMPATPLELDGIDPVQVEGVEVYSSAASVPPEYQRRVRCGATLIWMRRDMPGRPFSWRRTAIAAGAAAASIWVAVRLMGR